MRTFVRRTIKLLILAALFFGALYLFTVRPFVFESFSQGSVAHAQPERLRSDIKLLTSAGPRDRSNPPVLASVADQILQRFEESNSRVSLQTFLVQGSSFSNVISEYGFASSAGTIIIGAHYDTELNTPGADDNASGVAGLLELGRLLSQSPPPVRVLLVAYALEEGPFFLSGDMGSFIHAKSLRQANEKIRLMISLESIGYFADAAGSQRYPLDLISWLYPGRGDFIAIVGQPDLSPATLSIKRAFARSTRLPSYSINTPEVVPGINSSDHVSFWRSGFDAVMITDTAMFRNPNYHTPSDLPETLDYARMAQVVDGVLAYVMAASPR